ncbi:MAG: molybdopterin-dependent oxidoreductase [Chloroflexota bacterium]|nr:molybdopterin-dependent oxidoreductase [Chloroflexota bacterium]
MFGASLGSLSLKDLQQKQRPGPQDYPYRSWEDLYRQQWTWDKVAWGTHCVDCYPGNCPFRVYVKEGIVWREEQAGNFEVVEKGVPDMNPMGCQKGAGWSQLLYGKERILYPLKRAGERGEGKWKRVSWDEALTDIADAVLDSIQEVGPESVIHIGTPAQGGFMSGLLLSRLMLLLGGLNTDVQGEINDFSPGFYLTFGKFDPASSVDDWFHAELTFIWHKNPIYTSIPWYHFVAESRYNGGEVVSVAPDANPSTLHSDYFVPVRIGTDPALALAMCKVVIDEGIYNATFVKEQTDLPLLVREDDRHFLRARDVQDGGREDQFYFFDTKSQSIVEASRGYLGLDDIDPALEGTYEATLKDGSRVKVRPVFAILRETLEDYTPEKASEICGTNPDLIRTLARKVSQKRTSLFTGWNSGKYYHGDLMERSMCLLLALTGNWGKKGTGVRSWSTSMFDGFNIAYAKERTGREETQRILDMRNNIINVVRAQDPTMTEEMAASELGRMFDPQGGTVTPAFFWYFHAGYRENWNKREWHDPSMKRSFDDYMQEALEKGWWAGVSRPAEDTPPRVMFEVGGNYLRRTRGGQTMLLKHLWPKLKMFVQVDWRMNTTGLHSDIFLPAAQHYEKITFHIPTPHIRYLTLSDEAVPPAGESKPEWEIFVLLAKKIEERAKERGFTQYTDSQGFNHRLDNLYDRMTLDGEVAEPAALADEFVQDTAYAGTLPEDTTLDTLREKGHVRFIDWGLSAYGLGQASDFKLDETHNPFRWHTEKKTPYNTLTRRAQFYIDHDWFLEAGEELPVHKETPNQGGNYPFQLTSGHNRWSIHTMNITNRIIQQTHRGKPHMVMNPDDAAARGIVDDEEVRVFNDMNSFFVPVRLSPSVRPGQVIIYNGWEPYQFREWKDPAMVEPGMIKWLQLAGGYGHLRYWPIQWQPVPTDRAVRVDVAKVK